MTDTLPTTEGAALPERSFGPVGLTDFVRYQGASGDFNPIHHDPAFAQSAGYPGPFGVGMLSAGYMGTYLTDIYGADKVRRFAVQFREQVWPGDVLTATGAVTGLVEVDGEKRVQLDIKLLRQTGGSAIIGTAEFAVD
jgi:acyl dehydratase